MFRSLSLALCFLLGSISLAADNKEQGRLENCGAVMQEILDVPDNIPQELLEKAECVIVIASMTKLALGVGGSYGRGAMVCRSGKTFKGPWAHPRCIRSRAGASACSSGGNRRTSSSSS
jgi:lipid-binding SYLF domain-containing protein